MNAEFSIGAELVHLHIIEYKYFICKYNKKTKYHEFHIIQELMEGGDMSQYLKTNGP